MLDAPVNPMRRIWPHERGSSRANPFQDASVDGRDGQRNGCAAGLRLAVIGGGAIESVRVALNAGRRMAISRGGSVARRRAI